MFITIEASIRSWNRSSLVTSATLAVGISVIANGTLVALPSGETFLAVTLAGLAVAGLTNRSRDITFTVPAASLQYVAPGVRHAGSTLVAMTIRWTHAPTRVWIAHVRRTSALLTSLTPLTRESVIPRLAPVAIRSLDTRLAVALPRKDVTLLVQTSTEIARTLSAPHAGLQIPVAGHASVALTTLHVGFAHAKATLLVADSIHRSLDVAVAGFSVIVRLLGALVPPDVHVVLACRIDVIFLVPNFFLQRTGFVEQIKLISR